MTAKGWYWGHARAGPYSLVWFTAIDNDGKLHTSAYASSGGKVITATCTPNTLKVEPFNNPGGVGSIDQPEGLPDGFDVAVQIPGKGTLSMKVSNKAITQWLPGIAGRWMGEVKAGFKGKTQWTGSAFYEAFTFN